MINDVVEFSKECQFSNIFICASHVRLGYAVIHVPTKHL